MGRPQDSNDADHADTDGDRNAEGPLALRGENAMASGGHDDGRHDGRVRTTVVISQEFTGAPCLLSADSEYGALGSPSSLSRYGKQAA